MKFPRKIAVTVLALAVGLASSGAALAYAPYNARLPSRVDLSHLPPLAFQLFCLQNPQECRTSGPSRVGMNNGLMDKLQRVNARVNASMRPRSDGDGRDVWTVGASAGDCEDYALNKRHMLVAMGVPASSLRMAVVRTGSGEGHAVLVVHTGAGDYVLDNLTNAIRPFGQTGLRMVSMESGNPDRWDS